jgi:hypothetical protein
MPLPWLNHPYHFQTTVHPAFSCFRTNSLWELETGSNLFSTKVKEELIFVPFMKAIQYFQDIFDCVFFHLKPSTFRAEIYFSVFRILKNSRSSSRFSLPKARNKWPSHYSPCDIRKADESRESDSVVSLTPASLTPWHSYHIRLI